MFKRDKQTKAIVKYINARIVHVSFKK